jgi:hypothetical protein
LVVCTDTALEVFPLESRTARAALAKGRDLRSLKRRLVKEGPAEDSITAIAVRLTHARGLLLCSIRKRFYLRSYTRPTSKHTCILTYIRM